MILLTLSELRQLSVSTADELQCELSSGLAALADSYPERILERLLKDFQHGPSLPTSNQEHSLETRLKVGEVLMRASRAMGEWASSYSNGNRHILVEKWHDLIGKTSLRWGRASILAVSSTNQLNLIRNIMASDPASGCMFQLFHMIHCHTVRWEASLARAVIHSAHSSCLWSYSVVHCSQKLSWLLSFPYFFFIQTKNQVGNLIVAHKPCRSHRAGKNNYAIIPKLSSLRH